MNRFHSDNFIHNNYGETLVEIMMAFIVLMIVVAMFTGAITSAGTAVSHSIDIRRISDQEYSNLHEYMNEEKRTSVTETRNDPKWINIVQRTDTSNNIVFSTSTAVTDPTSIPASLTAYQYKSGDTIYWVFK